MGSAMAALGVAATFVWFGMVLAISFLEAPLKFRAPGVTVPIGLGIGRLVFRALNVAEVVLGAAVVVAVATAAEYGASATVASVVALAALAVQLIVVRPWLSKRTARVLAGDTEGPRSRAHLGYVALEVVKAVALLVAGVALVTG
ncbi:hypothetical protein [Cryptosporangium aurantiacum]|uniref:DUF4149 domain-containing protein n=1 Tax=Cryptosporangium aurantiacum TaxID=134849 RepID=A0A1M7RPR5_9ACTN|nr:hypothetical protein [Cryptosporangium aurantiacum]SHN48086.1 hypothetical protein SAMN05443668_13333 [Cryptosporangium aurantiacum]